MMLPVIFTALGRDLPISPVKYIVATNSTTYSSLSKDLSSVVGAKEDDITIYIERAGSEEMVRFVDCMDLIREKATCIMVCVGIPPGYCKVCEKAINYCMLPDFHGCVDDRTIINFKSSVGPIQRPPRGKV
jgi:hypothetical protein